MFSDPGMSESTTVEGYFQTQFPQYSYRLKKSFPCSRQSINRFHSVWYTTYQDSAFYVSIFLVSGKREGEEKPLFLCTIIFFLFLSRVYCHVLFLTGFCSATRNWRKLYKNLTVLSSLDAYTKNQIQSKELTSFRQVWILNNS